MNPFLKWFLIVLIVSALGVVLITSLFLFSRIPQNDPSLIKIKGEIDGFPVEKATSRVVRDDTSTNNNNGPVTVKLGLSELGLDLKNAK